MLTFNVKPKRRDRLKTRERSISSAVEQSETQVKTQSEIKACLESDGECAVAIRRTEFVSEFEREAGSGKRKSAEPQRTPPTWFAFRLRLSDG